MKHKAEFWKHGKQAGTRYYATRAQAQDALAKKIGHFHPIGRVSGDGDNADSAPRNGGEVRIYSK